MSAAEAFAPTTISPHPSVIPEARESRQREPGDSRIDTVHQSPANDPKGPQTQARGRKAKRKPSRIGRLFKGVFGNWLLWLTVVLPTAASAMYYGWVASDVYVTESRFVVRSPQKPASTGLGVILQSAGFARSQDESLTVQDFIQSRDALKVLNQEFGLSQRWSDASVDRLNRFGGIDPDVSFEALHRYYGKRVAVSMDTASSISTLRVSGFEAPVTADINRRLLEMGEELINRLNERGRQDLMRFAAAEVEVAERRARSAALALSQYRNQMAIVDPERQSVAQLAAVAKLQEEITATEIQLNQMTTLAPQNSQVEPMRQRVRMLRAEVAAQTARITGGDRSLVKQAAEFQRLSLEREFAERQLAVALSSLETARNDVQRKQLYLERIVQPLQADAPVEPRRLRAVVSTFVLGLVAWGVLALLVAGVREHRD
jgi:capsular polysaccharide transport system permease protein